mmetsp:Transcript_38922/g.67915  ORF Transcript_38922/g.67915 Transcript_38922/m.67915 type:complete len:167 (+) Transcript_38922:134-634(+)
MVAVASGNGYFCSSINPPRPTGGIRHNSNGGVGIYQKERAKKTKIIKAVVLFAIVALLIYVIADFASPRLGYFRRIFEQLVSWMEHNLVAGVFVFAFVFAVCTILFIPTPLLTFWAGFAWLRIWSWSRNSSWEPVGWVWCFPRWCGILSDRAFHLPGLLQGNMQEI